MRLDITLGTEQAQASLPIEYNHLVQAALYRSLDPVLSRFLHEHGFIADRRPFRMFTFSRLMGKAIVSNGAITFSGNVRLSVCSPLKEFCRSVTNLLIGEGQLRLGPVTFQVEDVSAVETDVSTTTVTVNALSPIVVYTTIPREDGHKYTQYYFPGEPEFNRLVIDNLDRKLRALAGGGTAPAISLEPVGRVQRHVVKYKGFIIKGTTGQFRLSGTAEMLSLALATGLGSKSSQGFGCIEMIDSQGEVQQC